MLDAHVHVWDLAVHDHAWIPAGSPIRRNFDVRDLRSAVAGTPVDGVVLVQVINDAAETPGVPRPRRQRRHRGRRRGLDRPRASPDIAERLDVLADGPLLGIRHQALAEADPAEWLRSPAVQRGLSALDAARAARST